MAMHMGPQHPGASMSASVQVPASLVHQNEYIPVVHPAPHPSPLGVVGVVGVDPESVGRQTTSKVVNQSSSEWNKRDVAKSKVRPCFLLFSTKKALSKVLYLILPLVLHTFYCMPLVARLCHSVALLT